MTVIDRVNENSDDRPVEPRSGAVQGHDINAAAAAPEHYRAGTLRYTRQGLILLFVWLMWGDFCFTLMEAVIPNVLNLKLQSLHAPNWTIGLFLTTIYSAMNFMVNPVVSFRSDRYRSRWGRRIPFLLFATPFVTLFLILIGFSENLGRLLHAAVAGQFASLSPTTTTIILIGVLLVCFQFFNMFISSVYYYLFNDVVPEAYLARCMALFRVFGSAATAIFFFFIFPHAQTHMRQIFLGAGLLYFVGFTVMCWKVKEGQYPPPPPNIGGRKGIFAAAKTYAVECFTHRFYWHYFLMGASWQLFGCINAFNMFFILSLGLTTKQLGLISGVATAITTLLLYPAGILADRFHPIRVMFIAMILTAGASSINFIYLFYDFTPREVVTLVWIVTCITLPITVLYSAASATASMRTFPKDRYGQFGSADAMVRSINAIIGGLVAGLFMDLMKWVSGDSNYYYRFVPFWTVSFQLLGVWFMYYVYRGWKRHGGPNNYKPPLIGERS